MIRLLKFYTLRNKIEDQKKSLEANIGYVVLFITYYIYTYIFTRNRYNDIIEASDILNNMKYMIQSFVDNVKTIETICTELSKSDEFNENAIFSLKENISEKSKITSSTSDLKVLVEAPEILWEYLESLQFMKAVTLYVNAKKSYYKLIEDTYMSENFTSLKIVHQSWAYVDRFYNIIQSKIYDRLMILNLNPEDYADAICSIYYLTNKSLMESIDVFLNRRSDLLITFLNKSNQAKTPEETMKHLLEYLEQIFLSLKYIHIIFLDEDPLLLKILDNYKDIEVSLIEYKQNIRDRTFEWLKKCPQNLPESIFNNFTSCFHLSQFEETISNCILRFATLEKENRKDNNENESSLISIFIDEIQPWTFIFRDKFMNQIHNIISKRFNSINIEEKLIDYIKDITSIQDGGNNDPDFNLSNYIWSFSNINKNIDVEMRKSKVYGLTTRIQSLLNHIDRKLLEVMDDITVILNKSKEKQSINIKLSDINIIKADIKSQCLNYIKSISEYITEKLNSLSKEINELSIGCILFLGRFIFSLGLHSNQLDSLIQIDSDDIHESRIIKKSHYMNELKNIVIEPYYLSYTIWIQYLSNFLIEELKSYLDEIIKYESNDIKNIRNTWKEVKISDNENDLELIPLLPSPKIINLINNVVKKIAKAGTFLIPQEVIEYLVYILSEETYIILQDFAEKLSSDHHKEIIIQSWFDSKYLCDLFGNRAVMSEYFQSLINKNMKGESDKKYDDVEDMIEWRGRVDNLMKKFRDLLDPIELAFYSPHITKNTKSAYEKYKVIFGVLNLV